MQQYRIVERGGQRDILGEGLLWSGRDNAVYWTDILAPTLEPAVACHRQGSNAGTMPEYIGWGDRTPPGRPGFIAGFKSWFRPELYLDPVRVRPIVSPEPGLPDNRLNDAKADSKGRIWAGTMAMAEKRPDGSLYRLDPGGALTRMDTGYIVCNGPALSADEDLALSHRQHEADDLSLCRCSRRRQPGRRARTSSISRMTGVIPTA